MSGALPELVVCGLALFLHYFRQEFGKRYCDGHEGRWGWDFTGHSNLLELNFMLTKTVMIRRTKV